MKQISSAILLLAGVNAISMIDYNPDCSVEPGFGPWYSRLLSNIEDPNATCGLTNFFAPNGSLIVTGEVSQGADAILRTVRGMLPADGSIAWNHFPNVTTVLSETDTEQTFELAGVLQTTLISDGSCSTTDFLTHFTVAKDPVTGLLILELQSGSLLVYDGVSIVQTERPCDK